MVMTYYVALGLLVQLVTDAFGTAVNVLIAPSKLTDESYGYVESYGMYPLYPVGAGVHPVTDAFGLFVQVVVITKTQSPKCEEALEQSAAAFQAEGCG